MSNDINNGGPAFPIPDVSQNQSTGETVVHQSFPGLSVRDYFAAKELAKVDAVSVCDIPSAYARLADHCYRMADAMIAAREQQ